ncbi:hypothetical protein [Streptomyces canus]|uniref:hypothetical protein n=1 Tax=Streptomyces canus TaxID=58343 RepID=UPI003F53EDC5
MVGGDRYRLLLEPARAAATVIVERGQQDGVFRRHLPPAVLSAGLEAVTVALLGEVNSGALADGGSVRPSPP